MKKIAKRFVSPALQFLHRYYFTKSRTFKYKGINLIIEPGVFPPNYLLSTKILIDFIIKLKNQGDTLLDVGCGSGALSIAAAKNGFKTTGIDINLKAIENSKNNAERNNVDVEFIQSNLFDNIKDQSFDVVMINPPFYPKNPSNDEENAWYCGENFEYFQKLFNQLSTGKIAFRKLYLILSEDCDIDKISSIALELKLKFYKLKTVRKRWEENYIFEVN